MKFAIKCSYVEIKGVGGLSVAKDPITDKGKRNKPGRLKLIKDTNGNYQTISSTADPDKYTKADDQLITIFENGKLLKEYSLDTIRATCDIDLDRLDFMLAVNTESPTSS
jgi:nicotinamide phosphoribosyltransferase